MGPRSFGRCDPALAEEARKRLAEHLDKLEVAAKRFEEKMALANGNGRLVRTG